MKRKLEFNGMIFKRVPKSKMIPYEDGRKVDLAYENNTNLKKLKQSIHLEQIDGFWIASIWNNKDWSIIKKSRKYSTYEKALKNILDEPKAKNVIQNNKEIINNVFKKLIDSKVTIVLIIAITGLIMFFTYNLYFSPMAQCVNAFFELTQGNNSREEIKAMCIQQLSKGGGF